MNMLPHHDLELTVDQAAILCGVAPATFRVWRTQTNAPPMTPNGGYKLSALGEWTRKVQVTRTGRGGGNYPYAPEGWGPVAIATPEGEAVTKDQADIRLKILQAEKLSRELDIQAGTLVQAEDVTRAWQSILSRVRTHLLKLPHTQAPLVHGDPDVISIAEKLKTAVRDALAEASEDWRDDGGDADDE